jgi:phage protein U
LEEGKVQSAREIDLAAVFGLGFPAFRGGLLWWADTLGGRAVLEGLRRLALGDRGNPTYLLESIASSEGSFYGQG